MKKLAPDQIEKILALRRKGLSYRDISRYGYGYCSVSKYCTQYLPELRMVARYYLSESDIDIIKRLRRRGLSLNVIHKKTGICYVNVAYTCKRYCPGLRNMSMRRFKDSEVASMAFYRGRGYTYRKIAKIFKCDPCTVQRNIKRHRATTGSGETLAYQV